MSVIDDALLEPLPTLDPPEEEQLSVTYTYEAPTEGDTGVSVVFVSGEITHERTVNAVFTDGVYDADATAVRVKEVARGVEHKIAVGAIKPSTEEVDSE